MKGLGLRLLVGNFLTTLGRQVVTALVVLGTSIIIARIYGPEVNGSYAVLLLLPATLSAILSLGIGSANVYLIGSGKCRPSEAVAANLYLGAVLSLLGLAGGAFFLILKGRLAFPGVDYPLLWLALPIFPLSLFVSFINSILQAVQDFRTFNRLLLVQPLVFFLGVTIGVVSASQTLTSLIIVQLISQFTSLLFALYAIKNVPLRARANAKSLRVWEIVRSALSFGCKAHLSGILAFVNYKADIFLLNLFVSPAAAGVYLIAVVLSEKLWILSIGVSTVIFPRLSELEGVESKRSQLTPIVTRVVLFVTLIGALALALCSYQIVEALFGSKYLDCITALYMLLPGVVVLSAARVLANDLASRNRPALNLYISFMSLLVNIVANVVLIPRFSLVGAAVATSLAYIFWSGCTLAVYCQISANRWVDTLFIKTSDLLLAMTEIRRLCRI